MAGKCESGFLAFVFLWCGCRVKSGLQVVDLSFGQRKNGNGNAETESKTLSLPT